MAEAYRLTGAMIQIMPSFCQSKPVFELFEKFFIQLFVLYGQNYRSQKVAVVYATVAKGVQPLQNP
ncbi:hypothetical protein BANRA_05148 [Klebsiella pneumoniae]|nr:hypothetical protein BANRA_05148 [Klebsiella pneumoniae]